MLFSERRRELFTYILCRVDSFLSTFTRTVSFEPQCSHDGIEEPSFDQSSRFLSVLWAALGSCLQSSGSCYASQC